MIKIKPDYVVINTDYTSRILNKLDELIDEIVRMELLFHDDSIYKLDDAGQRVFIRNNIMFIKDTHGSDKKINYISNDKNISKKIYEMLPKKRTDGSICFRVFSEIFYIFNLIYVLKNLRYCNCLDLTTISNMELYKDGGINILYIEIGCESG